MLEDIQVPVNKYRSLVEFIIYSNPCLKLQQKVGFWRANVDANFFYLGQRRRLCDRPTRLNKRRLFAVLLIIHKLGF